MKMPDPIIELITKQVASSSVRVRSSFVAVLFSLTVFLARFRSFVWTEEIIETFLILKFRVY